MLIGVNPQYYNLTHRMVGNMKDSGLQKIAAETKIPFDELQKFAKTKEIGGEYMPALYSHLFGKRSFLEASAEMDAAGWPST